MRELGFSVMWPKLQQGQFTTFRFPRRDKDWQVGETVRIVYHPRGRDRKVLGTAKIVLKDPRCLVADLILPYPLVIPDEAIADGFNSLSIMYDWIIRKYGPEALHRIIHKLTILWIQKEVAHDDEQTGNPVISS